MAANLSLVSPAWQRLGGQYTAQEIADQLVLSPKTVDTYRARVMDKLNLHHRAELVKYALRKGLLQPSE